MTLSAIGNHGSDIALSAEAYIALGSNIEPRIRHLLRAIHLLSRSPEINILATSRAYRSAAQTLDGNPQPDYLNAVIKIETTLDSGGTLTTLLRTEADMGRERSGGRWAPRTIDLDLLIFGDVVLDSEELRIPHPRLHQRRFVLRPLADVWPTESVVPGLGRTLEQLIDMCPDRSPVSQTIVRLDTFE